MSNREIKDTSTPVIGQLGARELLAAEIRQHRVALASLLRQLKLPDESAGASNQHRSAAQSRWAAAHGK